MFQSEHYCEGYETVDGLFWFSYFDDSGKEYYFHLSLQEVADVISKVIEYTKPESPK